MNKRIFAIGDIHGCFDSFKQLVERKIEIKKMPKMDSLPAYNKLLAGHLDADTSINILDAAKDEIEHIQQMLG